MIVEELRMLKESLLSLLFPPLCNFCDALDTHSETALCKACEEDLKPLPTPVCGQCGLPVPGLSANSAGICGRCLTNPPPYSRARFGFLYSGGLREGIVQFKYSSKLHLRTTLGHLLIDAFNRYFSESDYDLVVPVPIHRKRLVARGFNQVLLMAERLSESTGIRLDRACFQKTRDTPPQVGLTRAERLKNLRGCFSVAHESAIQARRVLVIDDVATTGSTIREATKTLLTAGAARADALVLALRLESADTTINEHNLGGNATWL